MRLQKHCGKLTNVGQEYEKNLSPSSAILPYEQVTILYKVHNADDASYRISEFIRLNDNFLNFLMHTISHLFHPLSSYTLRCLNSFSLFIFYYLTYTCFWSTTYFLLTYYLLTYNRSS
jgi:hypothetical protein